jgi:hypothetical protein
MTLSRQTAHNRRRAVEAIQARLQLLGLFGVVRYDPDRGLCVEVGETRIVGRYQVVHAWLDGYVAGQKGATHG